MRRQIILLCMLGAGTPGGVLAVELFGSAAVSYSVGDFPDSLAVADFDGDGALDLVVTNLDGNSLSILLGDDRGGFRSSTSIDLGTSPEDVAVGDLDADGIPDLAVANVDDGTVGILLGDGRGGFSPSAPAVSVGLGPVSIVLANIDADEMATLDLVVVNGDSPSVSIFLGDGRGGFSRLADAPGTWNQPLDVAVADFDADMSADLAVVDLFDNSVSILLGDGAGGFVRLPAVDVGTFPVAVTTGHFNADENVDLAVTNFTGGAGNTVSLLFGDGSGGFPDTAVKDVGASPVAIAAGDLGADGNVDLIIVNEFDNSLSLLIGDGQGNFASGCEAAGAGEVCNDFASAPRAVELGDFDGDGALDVAIANSGANTVGVALGNGLGGLALISELRQEPGVAAIAMTDLDSDQNGVSRAGTSDIALVNTLNNSVSIFLSDGLGGFTGAPDINQGFVNPIAIAAGRFDADAHPDLAVANRGPTGDSAPDDLIILLGEGDGTFVQSQIVTVGNVPESIVLEDFDANGTTDMAVTRGETFLGANGVSILLGDGDGKFEPHTELQLDAGPGSGGATGDFNGDDHMDLVVTQFNAGSIRVYLGRGDGSFDQQVPDIVVGPGPESIVATRFDGDDFVDLAVALQIQNAIGVLRGRGDGTFEPFNTANPAVTVGIGPVALLPGDFNGDGEIDLIVSNSGTDSLSILLGDGEGAFLRLPDLATGNLPLAIGLGDLDADGGADLAVVNGADDFVGILFNQLADRADLNGSNRIDGFDINAVGRSMGRTSADPEYRRSVDANLDGVIDGLDLSLAGSRFGELRRSLLPWRARLENVIPWASDTVTFQPLSAEGDLLTVRLLVDDSDDPVAAADFTVTYAPDDLDPATQVLEYAGFVPGTYLDGARGQPINIVRGTPGRIRVIINRLPGDAILNPGQSALIDLIFRARREGTATLDFAASQGRSRAAFLDSADPPLEVPGITFVGRVTVISDDTAGGTPGQRIGYAPQRLEFGTVAAGSSVRRRLRISNFGFSALRIGSVTTDPPFSSFFVDGFDIPPFGYVELFVEFTPIAPGLFEEVMIIGSDDPGQLSVPVPLEGTAN